MAASLCTFQSFKCKDRELFLSVQIFVQFFPYTMKFLTRVFKEGGILPNFTPLPTDYQLFTLRAPPILKMSFLGYTPREGVHALLSLDFQYVIPQK